jgi:hypothetical protein
MDALTYLVIVKIALIITLLLLGYIDLRSFQLPNTITIPMIGYWHRLQCHRLTTTHRINQSCGKPFGRTHWLCSPVGAR